MINRFLMLSNPTYFFLTYNIVLLQRVFREWVYWYSLSDNSHLSSRFQLQSSQQLPIGLNKVSAPCSQFQLVFSAFCYYVSIFNFYISLLPLLPFSGVSIVGCSNLFSARSWNCHPSSERVFPGWWYSRSQNIFRVLRTI